MDKQIYECTECKKVTPYEKLTAGQCETCNEDYYPSMHDLVVECLDLKKKLAATEAPLRRMAALENALTASPDTKSAYNGDFAFSITLRDEMDDEYSHSVTVPWTTVKDIMKKIKQYADENP